MNLEQKAEQAIARMLEFYEADDLHDFVRYCDRKELPYYKAILFLDGQTRADYFATNRNPKIWDYMKRTEYYFKGGNDNETK